MHRLTSRIKYLVPPREAKEMRGEPLFGLSWTNYAPSSPAIRPLVVKFSIKSRPSRMVSKRR
jgi:hypothetical protein